MNFYGPSELLTMNDHPGRMDHNAADSPEALLLGGPIQKLKPLAMAASPITHVSPDDAPMLLVHGTKDPLVPWQQSVAFLQALRKKGVEAALLTIEGGSHGGFRNPAIELRVQAFLDRCLLGRGAPIEDETLPNDVPAKNAAKESAAASTGQ